jgi:preprotein translocase SecE subunit
VVRAVGLNLQALESVGQLVTLVVLGGLLGLAFRGLFSAGGQRTMVTVEEQGWLHTTSYKAAQGLTLRRYTLLGLLLIGWSGVYSLVTHESLGRGDWAPALPFTTTADQVPALEGSNPPVPAWIGWAFLAKDEVRNLGLPVLSAIQYSAPLLIAAAVFWLSWRAVNVPAFADFLIATEAEMNKVSWSSRKRLFQDTVVVLVTTFLLTAFLLVTDLFWGWLLSTVKVLPGRTQTATQVDAQGGKKVSW